MNPLIKNHIKALEKLGKKYSVETLYLFGSLASNLSKEASDVDLLVKFSDSLQLLDYADNYFGLLEELQSLFNKKVDLVSEKSLKNPVLIEEINRTKISIL